MRKHKTEPLVFVIHKHHATSLHYDLRLEISGVMPSWAVPKGPTLDPTVRRLAMPTTDHTMEYRHFEGVIPEGNVGAGPVMIWDEGTYTPEIEIEKGVLKQLPEREEGEKAMIEGFKKGELKFQLHGKKLNGSFALVKPKGGFAGGKAWLLIKHKDAYVREKYDANEYDMSAKSNLSLQEIREKMSTS